MAHRSRSALLARMRSFFMRRLEFGVGLGNLGSGLAQSKTQLAEEPLTLPCFQLHSMFPVKIRREGGAVPHLSRQTKLGRAGPQGRLDLVQLAVAQTARASG